MTKKYQDAEREQTRAWITREYELKTRPGFQERHVTSVTARKRWRETAKAQALKGSLS